MVVETTKIAMFQLFASPRKEVDVFGKKVKLAGALPSSRNSCLVESRKLSKTALVPPTVRPYQKLLCSPMKRTLRGQFWGFISGKEIVFPLGLILLFFTEDRPRVQNIGNYNHTDRNEEELTC
jgi:hypothetical protein